MSNNDNVNVRISEEVRVVKYATIVVNGTERGKREINGTPTLSDFSKAIAAEFGIKTFTVSVDGSDVTTHTQANAPVPEGAKVAVAAKDSRGSKNRSRPAAQPAEEVKADAPEQPEATTEATPVEEKPAEPEAAASDETLTT